MTRRFTQKLIRIMLALGIAGSSTMAISLFRGCERDEVKKVRMLEVYDEM